jgi:hypothetical protein
LCSREGIEGGGQEEEEKERVGEGEKGRRGEKKIKDNR